MRSYAFSGKAGTPWMHARILQEQALLAVPLIVANPHDDGARRGGEGRRARRTEWAGAGSRTGADPADAFGNHRSRRRQCRPVGLRLPPLLPHGDRHDVDHRPTGLRLEHENRHPRSRRPPSASLILPPWSSASRASPGFTGLHLKRFMHSIGGFPVAGWSQNILPTRHGRMLSSLPRSRNSASIPTCRASIPPLPGPSTVRAVAQASAAAQDGASTVTQAGASRTGVPLRGSMVCESRRPCTSTQWR